jgi:hypothetical protein
MGKGFKLKAEISKPHISPPACPEPVAGFLRLGGLTRDAEVAEKDLTGLTGFTG